MLILNLYWIIILKLRLPPTFTGVLWENMVREMSEGNVYIPVKKVMRVRDSCLAIIFEIDRFVIYFYFFIVPNNVFKNPFLQQRYHEILTTIAEVRNRMDRVI